MPLVRDAHVRIRLIQDNEKSRLLTIWKYSNDEIGFRIGYCSPSKNTGHKIPTENVDKPAIWTIYRSEGFFSVFYYETRVVYISYDELVSTFCQDGFKTQQKVEFEVFDILSSYYRTKPTGNHIFTSNFTLSVSGLQ